MSDNKHFNQLVQQGQPIGEVVGVNFFLIKVRGLHPCNVRSLVMFEDGSKGYVYQIFEDYVTVLYLGTGSIRIGMTVVMQHHELVAKVGKDFIGRVVSVTGDPLDGKGPIAADNVWPVFKQAPMLYEREALDTQLNTGLIVLDTLFPVVRGQRMAILGDSKSGKTTVALQAALNQRGSDVIAIYVLIAKRRSDIDDLLVRLNEADAMKNAVVVVSTIFESLVTSYLAPYVACSIGEYLWQECNMDTVMIYDDLATHAHVYREMSLLSGSSPGRDSYPGDMFYAHSSLLERAGKLNRNHATQTALPIVNAPGGDITAFLPTNVMSITDGQWILDMKVFRDTMRPAISTGLSVTRIGGVGQTHRQQELAGETMKLLNSYREAAEFSHFGAELAAEAKRSLEIGKQLYSLMNQAPSETYSVNAQTLMLDIVLHVPDGESVDIKALKLHVEEHAAKIQKEEDFQGVRDALYQVCKLAPDKPAPAKEEKQEAAQPAAEDKKDAEDGKDKKKEESKDKGKEKEAVAA